MFRVLLSALVVTLSVAPAAAQTSSQPQVTASLAPATQASNQPQNTKEEWVGGPRPQIQPATPPVISFPSSYARGTVIVDTQRRRLLYVLSNSKAYLYPITVGRLGFQWTGTKTITAKRDWPDWRPPAEMRKRQPNLPVLMTGGINNPLGAKALYLGSSLYRIHGTNNTKSIGNADSSGCFRMLNAHVTHLAGITKVGTKVVVLNALPTRLAKAFDNKPARSKRVVLASNSAVQPQPRPQARQQARPQPQRQRPRNMAWRSAILGTN